MKKILLLTIAICIFNGFNVIAWGQDCDCSASLDTLISVAQNNYVAYKIKTEANKESYKQLCDYLKVESKKPNYQNFYCARLLQAYVGFFEDKHTTLSAWSFRKVLSKMQTDQEKRDYFNFVEKINMNEEDFKKYLNNKSKIDPIEGIYRQGGYICAVMKDSNPIRDYVGFILNEPGGYWQKGQVKFELKVTRKNQYNLFNYLDTHDLDLLQDVEVNAGKIQDRIKIYPETTITQNMDYSKDNQSPFSVTTIDDKTILIGLPDFDLSRTEAIDRLINDNKDKLAVTPNLIIDLRNNYGGGDRPFGNILSYLYTQPYVMKGNVVLCSDNTIKEHEESFEDHDLTTPYYTELIKRMKDNRGKFAVWNSDQEIKMDSVALFPKKIAIIVNRNTASSSEQFVLFALNSSKTIIVGENTSGCLDYSNFVYSDNKIYPENIGWWSLRYSTTMSNRLPEFSVDEKGIEPDVYLNKDTGWVEQTRKLLESDKSIESLRKIRKTESGSVTDAYGATVKLNADRKVIHLIFSADIIFEGAEPILQTLDKDSVKASFFLTGNCLREEKLKPIIREIIQKGHYVGGHSNNHLLYASWDDRNQLLVTPDSLIADFRQNMAELEKYGIDISQVHYFLSPYEYYNKETVRLIESLGQTVINYTPGLRTPADYTTPDMSGYKSSQELIDQLFAYEAEKGLNGSIILIHPGTEDTRTDKLYLRLDEIIRYLKGKGYVFERL